MRVSACFRSQYLALSTQHSLSAVAFLPVYLSTSYSALSTDKNTLTAFGFLHVSYLSTHRGGRVSAKNQHSVSLANHPGAERHPSFVRRGAIEFLPGHDSLLTAHRPPTTDHRSPTTDHRPPITDHRPPTTDHRPPTADRRPLFSQTQKFPRSGKNIVLWSNLNNSIV